MGPKTDPLPFIQAAYGIGIVLILIYTGVQLRLRKKLRALESAVSEGDS